MPRYVTRGRKIRQARYKKRAPTRKYRRPTRRSYRRRKSGGMTKKRILNATSRKKCDNMCSYTNVTAASPQAGTSYSLTAAVMPATQQYIFPWICTARNADASTTARGTITDKATRTAQTCFMRGLSENVEIQTSDGLPWQWRRICFTLKGDRFTGVINSTSQALFTETSNGYVRTVNTIYGNSAVGTLQGYLFRGAAGVDWSNNITAPVDTTNITLKYDRTITIASGNEDGMIRNYRMWHPMNKNLVYSDDEQGGGEVFSALSTEGKPGMGDYYVVDIFQPRNGGTSSSLLRFEPTAKLYWHEK